MAERFDALGDDHIAFIERQHIFFIGTAGADGFVNVSPKGMDSFRVVDHKRVAWLNLTGSGNESAAHVREHPRMTVMFCSFDKQPLILRIYGEATAIHPRDALWEERLALFPGHPGARQIFDIDVELVQTSCGYAVPHYEFSGERVTLRKWSENKGPEGVESYWREKNRHSMNGKPTGILGED